MARGRGGEEHFGPRSHGNGKGALAHLEYSLYCGLRDLFFKTARDASFPLAHTLHFADAHSILLLRLLPQTIAFLLPSIQRLIDADATVFRPGRDIGAVILAPTRELALQICQQASALVAYQHAWTVQAVYGGCSIQRDRAVLKQRAPAILVATPGRLLDLLREPTRVQGNRLLADVVRESQIVVLDEADRLLQAFPSEMNKILSFLPRVEKRQTMLFSATIPGKLKLLLSRPGSNILPADYVSVDCVQDDDVATQTNVRVEQSYVQLGDMKRYMAGLLAIVEEEAANDAEHCKLVIFFPTAKLVKFVAVALSALKVPVLSIHSRMGQGARVRASSQFREATRSILLTSDVSARGVDYPDVSLVVQV